jgi:RNA polymerase sigma-70 factor, ECF subfamily
MQPERSENAGSLDDALSAFVGARRRLFGIAYRVLASAAEAEDIVQDVWLRWQTTDRSVILDATAFLATMTTRLASILPSPPVHGTKLTSGRGFRSQ